MSTNKPTHALYVVDNSTGDGDLYWTFAYQKDGEFYHFDNDHVVLEYQGDKILKAISLSENSVDVAGQTKALNELLTRAILVAFWRSGDVDTEDGTYATTETDEMIHLESAIQEFFGMEAHELFNYLNAGSFIETKLAQILTAKVG